MSNRRAAFLFPALAAVSVFSVVGGAALLHTPDEQTIAIFDALGGWAAAIGALVAARYAWNIWTEQKAQAQRDRNAEALLLEAYFAADIVIWFRDLHAVRDAARDVMAEESITAYRRLQDRIDALSVDAFRAHFPNLWRMGGDLGPSIALALSHTVRLKELARGRISDVRPKGLLQARASALSVLATGALQGLQRSHDEIYERWGGQGGLAEVARAPKTGA